MKRTKIALRLAQKIHPVKVHERAKTVIFIAARRADNRNLLSAVKITVVNLGKTHTLPLYSPQKMPFY